MITKTPQMAFSKGFRVIGSNVKNILTGKIVSIQAGGKYRKYPNFTFRFKGQNYSCRVHQLCAWQKYGKKCMGPGIVIRHWDDNKMNFKWPNIRLGTKADNQRDKIRIKNEHQMKLGL